MKTFSHGQMHAVVCMPSPAAPPPPPVVANGHEATAGKEISLAQAITSKQLRKTTPNPAVSLDRTTKDARSKSVGSVEAGVAKAATLAIANRSDIISEMTATLARRRRLVESATQANYDAVMNQTDSVPGASNPVKGNTRKACDNRTPVRCISNVGQSTAPSMHQGDHKMQSGSSLSSQEDGVPQQQDNNGSGRTCASSGSAAVHITVTSDSLGQWKKEILGEVRRELSKAKTEIVDGKQTFFAPPSLFRTASSFSGVVVFCKLPIKNDSCSIPKAVTSGWTIHGLWPSKFNQSMGPFFCVPKDHFDLQKVKPLVPELLHHWPNLIPSASVDSLWQHEWIKHGTCAEQLVAISGELNYFSQGLQLNERFSIRNALVQAGIEPSDEPKFKAADVATAMEKARGKKVEVHCLKSPQGKWYLVDVRICIDKQLQAFDCPHPQPDLAMEQSELLESLELPNVEICPPTALLYYPPPRPDHYHSDEQDEMHSHAYKYTDEFGDKWDSHYEEADHDEL